MIKCKVASKSTTDRPQRSQPPDQHDVDLAAAGGVQYFLAGLNRFGRFFPWALGRARTCGFNAEDIPASNPPSAIPAKKWPL
jgi:hypothetical protein